LREIRTKAISVEAANSEVAFIGALDGSHVGQVKITPAEVKVTAFVEEINERQFLAVPVKKPRQVVASSPPSVDVIIAGPHSAVSRVEAKDIAVTVNAQGLQTGNHEVAPVVQVLKDVAGQLRSIRTEPEKISIQVR
jgi:YbbR domain-containing protein